MVDARCPFVGLAEFFDPKSILLSGAHGKPFVSFGDQLPAGTSACLLNIPILQVSKGDSLLEDGRDRVSL